MKLIDFYKKILAVGSLVSDDQGMVSAAVGSNTLPFMIDGKRLVLPLNDHLRNPDKSAIIVFHPLSENILGDESKVLSKFRNSVNVRLNLTFGKLIEQLLTLGISTGDHSKLKPDQIELLGIMKDVDETTLLNFQGILKAAGIADKDKSPIHVFLKRAGKVKGKTYQRAAIVSFGLYKELLKREKTVCGVKVRKKDTEILIKLMEYVLPGISEDGYYNKGSESDIGPFLDALMKSVMGIASNFNRVIDDFQSFIADAAKIRYEDEWTQCFDNLEQFLGEIRAIPMQAGNHGSTDPKPAAPPLPATPWQQAAQAPATNPGFGPAVAPAPAPTTRNPDGTVDFQSIINKNPALAQSYAMTQQGFFGQMPTGPQQARSGTPAWAAPNSFGFQNQPGMIRV